MIEIAKIVINSVLNRSDFVLRGLGGCLLLSNWVDRAFALPLLDLEPFSLNLVCSSGRMRLDGVVSDPFLEKRVSEIDLTTCD